MKRFIRIIFASLIAITLLILLSRIEYENPKTYPPDLRVAKNDANNANGKIYNWDLSNTQDASLFPWYDFDLVYGAIEGHNKVSVKINSFRSLDHEVGFIVFSRDTDTSRQLRSLSLHLLGMTGKEIIHSLNELSQSLKIPSDKIVSPKSETDIDRAYMNMRVVDNSSNPSIFIEVAHTYDSQKPYYLIISLYWSKRKRATGAATRNP